LSLTSWRAEEEILKLRQILKASAARIQVRYAHREHLTAAHKLANLARRNGWNYQGVQTEEFLTEHSIREELIAMYFERCTMTEADN
jgi:hypothetical protein